MTAAERASFLALRKTGVGGSDISAVFNLGWGCRLRLWFDKTGTPADYPDADSGPMKLGRFLEPFIAQEYESQTGRKLVEEPGLRHPDHPELLVHIDRTVIAPDRPSPGVAEFKAFGRGMYSKFKREGLSVDYVLQLQDGILIHDRSWGTYGILNRDSGDLSIFDIERDHNVTNMILEAVPEFWQSVLENDPPDRLDPDDQRCQSCRWRRTCQGNALMESRTSDIEQADELAPLLAEYDERKAMAEEAEALLDETKEVLRTEIGERQAVEIRGRKVYHRPQQRTSWETGLMAGSLAAAQGTVDYDGTFIPRPAREIEGKFKVPGKVFRSLRVY